MGFDELQQKERVGASMGAWKNLRLKGQPNEEEENKLTEFCKWVTHGWSTEGFVGMTTAIPTDCLSYPHPSCSQDV